jgi:diketogulonate reductase-like aldo/keto reductase
MRQKSLGTAAAAIPEIGFGTWRYEGGVEPLRKAISLGAALIDTAESYGTEELIGAAIKDIRRQVFLATKVSPKNFRRRDLLAAADRSLKRLKTDYIDLYQLHWPNYTVPIEETMAAMEELVDAGKIRFIGVSRFSLAELQKAQAALVKYKIMANQLRYSLIERTIESGLLSYCQAQQITVIAFSPLGQDFKSIKHSDPNGALEKVVDETGKTPAQIALNWCIAKENVVAIPKADSLDHVVENCGSSEWRLSAEQIEFLNKSIKYQKRSMVELMVRRIGQHVVQRIGRNLDLISPNSYSTPN